MQQRSSDLVQYSPRYCSRSFEVLYRVGIRIFDRYYVICCNGIYLVNLIDIFFPAQSVCVSIQGWTQVQVTCRLPTGWSVGKPTGQVTNWEISAQVNTCADPGLGFRMPQPTGTWDLYGFWNKRPQKTSQTVSVTQFCYIFCCILPCMSIPHINLHLCCDVECMCTSLTLIISYCTACPVPLQ